jgi:hypothetical protein
VIVGGQSSAATLDHSQFYAKPDRLVMQSKCPARRKTMDPHNTPTESALVQLESATCLLTILE